MTRVILVGNGPSVLNHELGDAIDSHDIVVRFNSYRIEGYEASVGKRTDFWFTTLLPTFRMADSFQRVYWHSWQWDRFKDTRFHDLLRFYPKAQKTHRGLITEMQELTGNREYFSYSTGAIAAHVLLKEFSSISLVGFDWWDTSVRRDKLRSESDDPNEIRWFRKLDRKDKHHYSDDQRLGRNHKPPHELQFFLMLAKANKITDINPESCIPKPR